MEPLSYQETITVAIALVAVVISVVSLRRTSRVQDQQLRLQKKQEELTDLQLEALRRQSAADSSSIAIVSEKADVRVELETFGRDHKFIITNWGSASATDVTFELELEPGRRSPLVKGDYDQKVPVPELSPGGRVPIWAAITMGMGTAFPAKWTWRNPDGSKEERRSLLAL